MTIVLMCESYAGSGPCCKFGRVQASVVAMPRASGRVFLVESCIGPGGVPTKATLAFTTIPCRKLR